VAYHDAVANGVDPEVSYTYYDDDTVASVVESSAPAQTITWKFDDDAANGAVFGSQASITEQDTAPDGSSSNFQWTYTSDSLTSVTETETGGAAGSSSFGWSYDAQGALVSASQRDDYSDGSSDSFAWEYNGNATPLSVTETTTSTDGTTTTNWTNDADGSPASIAQTITNPDGSVASTTAWTYSGGILNSVTSHANSSDGTSEDSQWSNNADGTLVVTDWTNAANGSPSAVSKSIYNAAGILVNDDQWSLYPDGSVSSYTEVDNTSDGSLVDDAAYLYSLGVMPPGVTAVTGFQSITFNPDHSTASFVSADLNADETSTFESLSEAVSGGVETTSYTVRDYNADGSLAHLTDWSNDSSGSSISAWQFGTDGSSDLNSWTYYPDGSLQGFFQQSTNANGNLVMQETWAYDAGGSLVNWKSSDLVDSTTYRFQVQSPSEIGYYYNTITTEQVWLYEYGSFSDYSEYQPPETLQLWWSAQVGWIEGLPQSAPPPSGPDFAPDPLPGLTPPTEPSPPTSAPATPTAGGATSPPSVDRSSDPAPPSAPDPAPAPPAPGLVEVDSVSTSDSREVTVAYDIVGPGLTQSFNIGIYRSSSAAFGSGINVLVGSVTVSGTSLLSGRHQLTETLSGEVIDRSNRVDLISPLAPDPPLPYVLAHADPEQALPAGVSTDSTEAHFRIYVIGAVVQGFGPDEAWVDSLGGWTYGKAPMQSLTVFLEQHGYDVVIGKHWNSLRPVRGQAVKAGDELFQTIEDDARGLGSLQPNDVIDVHLIGHSRGSAVIDQTMNDLAIFQSSLEPQLAHGYYKMTMLDPHPANPATIKDTTINPLLPTALPLGLAAALGPGLYSDPAISVPSRVNQVEDYYQKTPAYKITAFDIRNAPNELFFDFQGLSLQEMSIEDTSKTVTTSYDLTPLLLGHSEVYGWYEQTIMPTLNTLAPLVLSNPGSPAEGTGQAVQLDVVPSSMLLKGPDGNYDPVSSAPFTLYVFALNAQGNPDPTFNGSVSLSLAANPGNSVLGGTLRVNAVNGIATFSNLTISNPGSGYTFAATSSGLTSATSVPVDVEPYQLVLTSPPPASIASGSPFGFTVTAENGAGKVDKSFNGNVTVALGNYIGGTVPLSGTVTVRAVKGVATLSGLKAGAAGDYFLTVTGSVLTGASSPISITAGTASQLAVTFQPAGNVTASSGFDLTVCAEDSGGNVDTTFNGKVTLALGKDPGGGKLSGMLTAQAVNGIAEFSGLTIDTEGSGYALSAASSGLSPAISAPLDITAPGIATHLVMTTQPASLTTAESGFSVAVAAVDDSGTVDKFFQGQVALSVEDAASNTGILSGTLTVQATLGVATFSGLTIGSVEDNEILQAASAGLGAAVSDPFDVTPAGTATQLVVTTEPPSSVAPGNGFGLTVAAEDGLGNVDATFNGSVTVALPGGPFGSFASLVGTLTVQAANGVAVFSGLTLDQAASCELSVTTAGLAGTATTTITISGSSTGPMTPALTWNAPASITYGTPLSTMQLDASATVPGTFSYYPAIGSVLAVGSSRTLRVTFTPTDQTDYVSADATVSIDVQPAAATLTLRDAGGTYNGSPFAATATVAGVVLGVDSTPGASLEGVAPTLTYYAGATAAGTPLLNAPTDAGTYTALASFAGSADYSAAQSTPVTFTIGRATAKITMTSSPHSTVYGQPVTLVATVAAGEPTGTVSFFDGATLLATVPVDSSDRASLATSALGVGSHSITAAYNATTNFLGATSGPVSDSVGRAATSVVLSAQPVFTKKQLVTFNLTAKISPQTPGSGVPTGVVVFELLTTKGKKVQTQVLGNASVKSHQATLTVKASSVLNRSITVIYGGDTNFRGSKTTAPALTQTGLRTMARVMAMLDTRGAFVARAHPLPIPLRRFFPAL